MDDSERKTFLNRWAALALAASAGLAGPAAAAEQKPVQIQGDVAGNVVYGPPPGKEREVAIQGQTLIQPRAAEAVIYGPPPEKASTAIGAIRGKPVSKKPEKTQK